MKFKNSSYIRPINILIDLLVFILIVYVIGDTNYYNIYFISYSLIIWLTIAYYTRFYIVHRYTHISKVITKSLTQFIIFSLAYFSYFAIFKEGQIIANQKITLSIFIFSVTFFLSLCIADISLEGDKYLINEKKWRFGIACKLLGTIISFSLVSSMLNIMAISLERFYAIVWIFKINVIRKYSLTFLFIFFIFSLFIGVFPLFSFHVINISSVHKSNYFISFFVFSRNFIQNQQFVLISKVKQINNGFLHLLSLACYSLALVLLL